jgi:hypothetical protein
LKFDADRDGGSKSGYNRTVAERQRGCVGEIMIGPPGLPKFGRRVFSFAVPTPNRSRQHRYAWKWVTGLYLAGVLAHFSHHMANAADLPGVGIGSFGAALTNAPISLIWPADLIGTLIALG